jgi:hypothetical protein
MQLGVTQPQTVIPRLIKPRKLRYRRGLHSMAQPATAIFCKHEAAGPITGGELDLLPR